MKRLSASILNLAFLCSLICSCDQIKNIISPEDDTSAIDKEEANKPEPNPGEFVILFTNDFHSQIEPISKDDTYNPDRGGVKRIKALVDSVRAAEPVVLLADAGVRLVISDKKVKSVTVNGKAIEDNRIYKIATIDYLANTGEYGLNKGTGRVDAPEFIRDLFGNYFRHLASQNSQKQITAAKDGRITVE